MWLKDSLCGCRSVDPDWMASTEPSQLVLQRSNKNGVKLNIRTANTV